MESAIRFQDRSSIPRRLTQIAFCSTIVVASVSNGPYPNRRRQNCRHRRNYRVCCMDENKNTIKLKADMQEGIVWTVTRMVGLHNLQFPEFVVNRKCDFIARYGIHRRSTIRNEFYFLRIRRHISIVIESPGSRRDTC